MRKFPLAIVGCEVLTPLDVRGGEDTWDAIRAGRRVGRETGVRAEWLLRDVELDRSVRLGLAVARRALGGREVSGEMGLFCGTSKGPVGVYLAACERLRRGEMPTLMQARHVMLGVGAMGVFLAERLGEPQEFSMMHTSVAACASGVHGLHRAACALWRGECARALVVAADASLHPLFEGSFERMKVLSPLTNEGDRRCEPFGERGEGFFLIEAAAAILLERGDAVRGAEWSEPVAWLEDSWIGGDGTALVAVDARTETLRAGLGALLPGDKLAFVHAHATGTQHDAYERAAIEAVAGREVPVFSCKGSLGHSLGAAGLVSVAFSVKCHEMGETIYGEPVARGGRSLTVAQGFGGHVGVVRLRGG